jgi:hypothetical protein
MHNVERYHRITHDLFDHKPYIQRKNFLETLYKVGNEKCVEYLGESINTDKETLRFCRNEFMVATSCVLLNKANGPLGDLRDNVGLCEQEIKIVKNQLKEKFNEFPFEKMDEYLRTLSLSVKSFC